MRRLICGLVALLVVVVVAALAPQEKSDFPFLDWALKAKSETPPIAVLVELGLKDEEETNWSGRAVVTGAKVVHREGYCFRPKDKLIQPDAWEASSHRPIRAPANAQRAALLTQGYATVGIVFHLADLKPDEATLAIDLASNQSAKVPLGEVLSGKRVPIFEGRAVVRRISTATPLVTDKTEDDFPAAAYGPDGTLWVAYISYHLKDENRRVEQKPLQEQPADFKSLYTPGFGDQLFVKYYKDGKWSEPIAVTGPSEDLVRCTIAVEGDGTAWACYSANRDGNYDIYARPISARFSPEAKANPSPRPGPEERLTQKKSVDVSPVSCTMPDGSIVLVYQNWMPLEAIPNVPAPRDELQSGAALMFCRRGRWTNRYTGPGFALGGPSIGSHSWNATVTATPHGGIVVADDSYESRDYDVGWHILDQKGLKGESIVASSRFEARPAVCYDPKGRLWIAYEEGPTQWGKDYGAFDLQGGNPLYNQRSVRVVCLDTDGKLKKPVAELPTGEMWRQHPELQGRLPNVEKMARYAYPKIGIDGKGRVWVTYRVKFGTRQSTHPGSYWLTFARRLDGDTWSEPIELHHSDGLLDHRPVLLPHSSGGLLVIHNTDGRYTTPEQIDNQIYSSIVDLPGEPVEPKLVPFEPQAKDPKLSELAKKEADAVKRIRDYRIEHGGKKLQLLRGEFHRHTEISWDGGPDGSLEDMFRYAIDAAAMDWIGNGDHDNGAGREYSWWLIQKFTDAYHVPGVFTPMFTYERSVAYPHGHRNCVFAQRGVRTLPRLAEPNMQKRVGGVHADDAKMLYRYLHELGGICAGHTCATGMGTDWRDNDPVVEPIVEIYQGDRMSYEYEGCPRAGYDPKGNQLPAQIGGWQPAGFLTNAFKKGYRLGFQASSDHWSTHISYCIVLAEERSRQAILDAMRKRHVYGATDNIILDVKSGPHLMGDEFKTDAAPTLEIKVTGADKLARIDILRDSEVIDTIKPTGTRYEGKWTDPKPLNGTHYYYVRVEQEDEELAWGSPMWITR